MAKSFISDLKIVSDAQNDWEAHQVGAIVGYQGNDGIKYYVILERKETPPDRWSVDYAQRNGLTPPRCQVILETAMIANPSLEIGGRTQKRTFSGNSCFVLNEADWLQVQQNFMQSMRDAANERLAKIGK